MSSSDVDLILIKRFGSISKIEKKIESRMKSMKCRSREN